MLKYSEIFNKCVEFVLDNEGGYVNDPDDYGGATNYGISLRFLKSIKPLSAAQDIMNLTKDNAIDIYHEFFWEEWIDNLDDKVSPYVFDMIVNLGKIKGIEILQEAINDLIPDGLQKIKVDGILGPKTTSRLSSIPQKCYEYCILNSIRLKRINYYQMHSKTKFINGLILRALKNCN